MRRFRLLPRAVTLAALVALVLAPAACASHNDGSPAAVTCPADTVKDGLPLLGADCDPLVPDQCGFPFPSNVWTVDDATTKTGKRPTFGPTTLPQYHDGKHIDPALVADRDGFSPGQTVLTYLRGATITGLPTQDTIALSVTDASPTLLIDADTGARIPHFSEIDQSFPDEDDAERTLMIRPVVRLADGTRYIVAIRRVVDATGTAIAPSPAFAALRDGSSSCDVSVTRRRDLYKDIFGRLDKAGVKKDDLQIAWDYTTASRDNTTKWLLHMRDDALAKVGSDGPAYTIKGVEENPNPNIRRRIHVMMTVPLYVDKAGPGAKLVFDANGMPKQNGTAEYEVLVHVPNSATPDKPAGLIQNGHGLLGLKTEGQDGYLATFCDQYGYVGLAVDLIGMAHDDVTILTDSLVTDVSGFKDLVGRQHQGILNSLLAMRMMKGRFWKDPLVQMNGKSVIDPTRSYYRGDSQGGIFGTTYMAVSTDVTRGLLGEPGMPYSLLLNRSSDFGVYFILLRSTYHGGRNIELLIGLSQMLWDRTEPDGYANGINESPLPGTPSHEVLIHAAIGDQQVTPLGAHIIARGVKAKNLKPVNRSVFGIDEADGPFMGSGLVEFNFGLPDAPKTDTAPTGPAGSDPHDKVRKLPEAMGQADHFFRTGEIKAYCKGPCDPQ